MRVLKPWTLCARHVRPVLEGLGAATPFLIEEDIQIEKWVRNIPFLELMLIDDVCRSCDRWTRSDLGWLGNALKVVAETEEAELHRQRLATQLAMRIYCVMDLARFGPPSVRKAIPWTGDLSRDLKHVLVVHWRESGIWWAAHYGHHHMRSSLPETP